MLRGKILDAAKKVINTERLDKHGSPENNFKIIASFWQNFLQGSKNNHIEITAHDVCIMMALLKIARVASGSSIEDSYTDAAGYIALAADTLTIEK